MNTKKIKLLMLITFLFFLLPTSLFAQKVIWDYPVKPGTEKWEILNNNPEKVNVCQIPTQLLSELKTADLLNICLNYPLLPDIFAFNIVEDGFGKFESDFNGFRELIARNDVMKELLKIYEKTDPSGIPVSGTILEKGNYVLKISFIELFASHAMVTGKSTTKIKKEFVKELVLKKGKKKLNPEWYNNIGIQTNILAIVKIIKSDTGFYNIELSNTELTSFIHTGNGLISQIQQLVDEVANKYIIN